jgi:DNA-binding NarL/FixJ family response regulator
MRSGLVLIDDHAAYRSLARALLEREGFEVLGEAYDGDSAVEVVERLRPGLVLLDVHLPGDDGFAVAERLAALSSPPDGAPPRYAHRVASQRRRGGRGEVRG